MPILDVDKAQNVVVMKRGRGSGYAGIQNELYFEDNTQMLFGDAKASLQAVIEPSRNSSTDEPARRLREDQALPLFGGRAFCYAQVSTDRYGGVDRWKLSTYSLF